MVKSQDYPLITKKHLALIAPLDWGLGHTTRCIPVIRELQKNNFEIIIACNSDQRAVLHSEFPNANFIFMAGYGLSYGRSRVATLSRLILSVPKILIAIKRENRQLKRIFSQFNVNIVISDNRYGVFSSDVHCIFMTHQLNVSTGLGKLADWFANRFISKSISRFNACWVPDFGPDQGVVTLAGKLSAPRRELKIPVTYLGPLSRFAACKENNSGHYILVVLSGPEPQRTLLEEKILIELKKIRRSAILVRGVPRSGDAGSHHGSRGHDQQERQKDDAEPRVKIIDFAGSHELNELICNAGIVVCRAGYTSVMDLTKLQKKAVYIPTPGQAEQEYLARHLAANGKAVIAQQSNLNLQAAIEAAERLPMLSSPAMDGYKEEIRKLAEMFANDR